MESPSPKTVMEPDSLAVCAGPAADAQARHAYVHAVGLHSTGKRDAALAALRAADAHHPYDGGGPGKGGMATLFVNDEKVAEGRNMHTQAGFFSADETADIGIDLGTPVVEAMGSEAKSRFNGKISKLTVQVRQ